ncbi:Uncharacterised protein [uncultured archaeon]|nr:Uncharacterised protein [uncultured archaeon]
MASEKHGTDGKAPDIADSRISNNRNLESLNSQSIQSRNITKTKKCAIEYNQNEAAKKKTHTPSWSVSGMILGVAGALSGSPKATSLRADNKAPLVSTVKNNPRYDKSVIELIKSDMKQHRQAIIAASAVLFVLSAVFFYNYMRAGIVLLALTGMGAVSRTWQRFFPLSFGIELVMLATVISGVVYGALAGAIVGIVSMVLSTLLTQEDPGKMWPAFATITLIGILSGTLPIANIALWGVIFTVVYDAIISAIYIATGFSPIKTLIFDATHIAFNYFIFYNLAPVLMSIVGR